MTMSEKTKLIRDFVRGERESDALRALGASFTVDRDVILINEPAGAPVYEATTADVAVGLLMKWAVGTSLRHWARLLLTTGMVDLSALEDHP